MRIKYLLSLATAAVFGMACTGNPTAEKRAPAFEESPYQTRILGNWRMAELLEGGPLEEPNAATPNDNLVEELIAQLNANSVVAGGYTLHLFADSTYHLMEQCGSETGTWRFVANEELEYGPYTLSIGQLVEDYTKKQLVATITDRKKGSSMKAMFASDDAVLEKCQLDPFHPTNNLWRQRPTERESDEAIRDRLANYILHNALILKAAMTRHASAVSFECSQGIISIYRGGIGIVPIYDIHPPWAECFYDDEDAMRAYELFDGQLTNGLYRGGSTRDWIKDDYQILLALFNKIRQLKTEG